MINAIDVAQKRATLRNMCSIIAPFLRNGGTKQGKR
jgi:hypothetical protein